MNLLPEEKHEYDFQMTSFVDVIFVLLSFFVLGTTFSLSERDFDLGYRQSQLSPGARMEDFPKNVRVELRRQAEGVAITIGRAQLAANDFDGIRAKLTEINMPSLEVLVLAEPDLTVDQVAKAMDAALASPMKKIAVSSLPKSGPAVAGEARDEALGIVRR
jgi:biopolymer transport protein ExbD